MKTAVVLVAAGSGRRLGVNAPKCLYEIEDIPLFLFATAVFSDLEEIVEIVLVVPESRILSVRESVNEFRITKVSEIVIGGATRQDSVKNGVQKLSTGISHVLIHDGARPFISSELTKRLVDGLNVHSVVLPFLPVSDTLHYIESGNIAGENADRSQLAAAQTPQGFKLELLRQAYASRNSNTFYTDEVSLIRDTLGVNAKLIEGEQVNIKITTKDDLELYEKLFREKSEMYFN